jgi:hypothetical protein
MVRFEKDEVPLELLYCRVNVFEPAVRSVITVVVLACTPPVPLLLPCSRITARASVAAWVVEPETAKLIDAVLSPPGSTNPVMITIALVPVVRVTDGLEPPPVREP